VELVNYEYSYNPCNQQVEGNKLESLLFSIFTLLSNFLSNYSKFTQIILNHSQLHVPIS
jgi:hypothetical protein